MLLALTGVGLLTSFGATASAADVHTYAESFGKGELAMTWQSSIEINQETGEVYVSDTDHSRIAKFTAAGTPDGVLATITEPTAIAVDNSSGPSAGDVYVLTDENEAIVKLDPLGLPVNSWGTGGKLTGLEEILGITVDSDGNLWVESQDLVLNPEKLPAEEVVEESTITLRGFDQAGSPLGNGGWVHEYYPPPQRATPAYDLGAWHGYQSDISLDADGNLYAPGLVYAPDRIKGDQERFQRQLEKILPSGQRVFHKLNNTLGIAADLSEGRVDIGFAAPLGKENFNALIESYPSEGLKENSVRLERFGGGWEIPRGELNARPETSVDGLQEPASVAVYEADHAVYVADPIKQKVNVYRLETVEPPTVTLDPAEDVTQTSAHFVGHIEAGTPPPSGSHVRDVAWVFECTPKCPGHTGYVEADGQPHTAEATIGGLEPGTEYSIRLAGENHGGIAKSESRTFVTAPAAPGVKTGNASKVSPEEATLNAQVNPNGAATTYHFEYLTRAAFEAEGFGGAQTQMTPESEPLPPPAGGHSVSARIAGLEPATEYVFRAVAVNSIGTTSGAAVSFRSQLGPNPLETDCPNQALRTGAGARLPDCRAYELVSPAAKQGSAVEPFESWLQTTPDGSGVTWATSGTATGVPSPGQGAHQESAFYLSSAGAGGWSSQRLLPPEAYGELGHFSGLTKDGRFALLETTSSRTGTEPALYLLDTANQAITTVVPPQTGQVVERRAFVFDGASLDNRLFFFETALQLTGNAAPGKNNLYLWNRETGVVSLAGILPGVKNEAPAGGSFGGAYAWWPLGAPDPTVGGGERALYVGALHAISDNGDSVFFTAGGTGQLYLRRGLTGSKPTTARVSVANAGVSDKNGEKPAAFQEATPNGEKVFFLSSGKLTQDANTGPADEGSDLYRYDAAAKKLVDVAPLPDGAGARVQGLIGVAEDGESGYFAAEGVLAPGGVEGRKNLYHFEEDSGGGFAYSFLATLGLDNGEESNWSPNGTKTLEVTSAKTGRVSADGDTILFMSELPLTGETQGVCIYGGCRQVYRYEVGDAVPTCISCNPSNRGLPMIGAELTTALGPFLFPENYPFSGDLSRNLSASGKRAFFQTSESLLPEDVNGQGCTEQRHCVDVYEWEVEGTGSCKQPNVGNGCLYLLSSGESARSSYFVGASEEGDSAFFITDSPLVPGDRDELGDMYVARVDGGLSAQHVVPSQSCGSAEACKGAGSTPPPATSPGTQSFQGPGNPKPAACKKGFVRKHGKCVKKRKHHRKKRHHRRHSGGAK